MPGLARIDSWSLTNDGVLKQHSHALFTLYLPEHLMLTVTPIIPRFLSKQMWRINTKSKIYTSLEQVTVIRGWRLVF